MMKENLKAEIVDIETAFLYGNLEEEIFMKQPQGLKYMESESDTDNEHVLVLKRSIYGLVQASRQFFKKLRDVLIEKMRFEKCLIDQCLLSRKGESGILIICLYIDDTMIVGNEIEIKKFKEEIKLHFKTKEEGEMKDYVGCMIQKKNDEIFLHQSDLIDKLKKEFGEELNEIKKVETPAIAGEGIVMGEGDEKIEDSKKHTKYRSGVGMLLFLVKYSRPDISNAVRELSKANLGPNPAHYKKLLRVIKYVIDSKQRALHYKMTETDKNQEKWEIKAYGDSDFAGDKDKRLSVTGFCIYIYGCLVSWKSHGQKTVALSSTEAEYIAISELCAEILLIKSILEFLKIEIKLPIIVHCDNIGAIYLGHNAKLSQRTKHIDVKHHFVREYVEKGLIKILFVKSEENDADIWTKNVKQETYDKHTSKFMKDMI